MKLYPLYSNQLLLTTSSPTFAGLTLTGNLLIPDAGYIGSVSDTTALQIEADGDILLSSQLGIGITPGAQIEISKDAANATLILSCYHDTEATTPLLTMRKGEGTAASHASAIDDNAVLGTILFQGYDSNSWANGAKIEARVMGDPADGDMPTELTFWTTPDGGSETPVERMSIGSTGFVGVGVPPGIYPLQISSGFVKTEANLKPIFLFGSNEGTTSFGVKVSLYGHATPASRYFLFQTGDDGVNDGNLCFQLYGGNVGLRCLSPAGILSIGDIDEGGIASLNIQTAHETHTLTLGATSVTTTITVPTGAMVLGASFCVNTAVTDDAGDDTWTAAFSGGDATALGGGAAAQNTKVNTLVVPAITTGATEVTFTPNGGNFTAGVIEVIVYYIDTTSLANA